VRRNIFAAMQQRFRLPYHRSVIDSVMLKDAGEKAMSIARPFQAVIVGVVFLFVGALVLGAF